MSAPQRTPHRGVFTVHPDDLPELLHSAAVTPTVAVADAALAREIGPSPQLPPGLPMMARVRAEAAKAGVPANAVLMVTVANLESAIPAGMLPPALAAVKSPPTVIVGTEPQGAAVLAAAEAVVASAPGLRRRA